MKIENEKKNIDFLSFSIQKHLVTLFGFEEEHIVFQDRHQPQARVEKGTFESGKRSKHQQKIDFPRDKSSCSQMELSPGELNKDGIAWFSEGKPLKQLIKHLNK